MLMYISKYSLNSFNNFMEKLVRELVTFSSQYTPIKHTKSLSYVKAYGVFFFPFTVLSKNNFNAIFSFGKLEAKYELYIKTNH